MSRSSVKKKKPNELKRYRDALKRIAEAGDGMKESVIDWENVGKNAKIIAKSAIHPRCPTCGRPK